MKSWNERATSVTPRFAPSSLCRTLACMLALWVSGCTTFDSIDKQVFTPPAGWYHWPARNPLVSSERYHGAWINGLEEIFLEWWTSPPGDKHDPTKSPHSFEQSTNSAYSNFRLESVRVIRICGDHRALMQAFRARWAGLDDAFVEVYTKWGDTTYWAQYYRPASAPADQAAIASLKTLCAGAPRTEQRSS